jgi:lysophospholipase L1-like esterase
MFDIQPNLRDLEASIIAYEQEPIEKGKILFYGHSWFTRWGSPKWGYRRMDEDIRMKDGSLAVVNHGFGTSTSEELLYYYPRMVRPWEPRALVIGTRPNDTMYGYSPEETMANISKICQWARVDFPGIRLFLMEAPPSPKGKDTTRKDLWNNGKNERDKFNEMIRIYADTHEDTKLVSLWDKPEFFETPEDVGNFRKVREDIYVPDQVHLNQEGYDILGPIFREALDDLL